MSHLTRALVVASLSLFAFSGIASAMPYIDPALRPLLNSDTATNKPVRVYVRFNDLKPLPNLPHNRQSHQQMELAMMANARASQTNMMNMLTSMHTEDASIKVAQLWLFNGMIVELPGKKFVRLTQIAEVKAIHANHKIRLLDADQKNMIMAPTAAAGPKFTWGLDKIGMGDLTTRAPNINGDKVVVGILDTGIDANHPDLKGKLLKWKDFVTNHDQPMDDHGHGTHVSGTIAGGHASGTQIGIAPGAKIIMARVFDSSGSTTDDVLLRGMQWMADPDGNPATNDFPSLVSNSWGAGAPDSSEDPKDNADCQAVDAWVKLGMLPVFAAGNDGPGASTVGTPGACPTALAVGATTKTDDIASFSSRGPTVWKTGSFIRPIISAPGKDVQSAAPGGKYATMSGTSMATPHASGLAALMYQLSPNATVEGIVKGMEAGADDLGAKGNDNEFGFGRINIMKTLKPALVGHPVVLQ